MNHEKPDRTPRLLYGEVVGYVPAVDALLKEKCSPRSAREYFEMDLTGVDLNPTRLPRERFAEWLPEGTLDAPEKVTVDEWGICRRGGGSHHFSHIESPLAGVDDFEKIKTYPWPDLDQRYRFQGLAESVAALHAEGVAVAAYAGAVFECAWQVRGMEALLEDMLLRPEVAHFLLERIGHFQKTAAVVLARTGIDLLILGDDVGMQTGMLMSLGMWREFLKPRLRETMGAAKAARPEVKIFYHSDGNIEPVIPELVEVGVEVLNPVQPECMDPAEIKRKYGSELAFFGTVSVQRTMPFGSPRDVREEVRTRIRTVGYDGGLILSPAHVLEPEVPWENILAFFEAASAP